MLLYGRNSMFKEGEVKPMVDLLYIAVVFLVIALVAYVLGARGLAWFSADIAKFIVWLFVILFIIALIARFLF
jgi:uncharacterized membrane protein YtjA (UPF0391 family)